jgi:hypothetical protein
VSIVTDDIGLFVTLFAWAMLLFAVWPGRPS